MGPNYTNLICPNFRMTSTFGTGLSPQIGVWKTGGRLFLFPPSVDVSRPGAGTCVRSLENTSSVRRGTQGYYSLTQDEYRHDETPDRPGCVDKVGSDHDLYRFQENLLMTKGLLDDPYVLR